MAPFSQLRVDLDYPQGSSVHHQSLQCLASEPKTSIFGLEVAAMDATISLHRTPSDFYLDFSEMPDSENEKGLIVGHNQCDLN